MKELAPHQQRVIQEKQELDERLAKLNAFISNLKFDEIVNNNPETSRLIRQKYFMEALSEVLGERIAAFK